MRFMPTWAIVWEAVSKIFTNLNRERNNEINRDIKRNKSKWRRKLINVDERKEGCKEGVGKKEESMAGEREHGRDKEKKEGLLV